MSNLKTLRVEAGFSTMTEAAKSFGVSPRTWQRWESGDERSPPKAVIDLLKIQARGLSARAVRVPILGEIPAGVPILAVEDHEGYVEVEPRASTDRLFALRVRGESMLTKGVEPGDVIICRQSDTADPGDIVVAMVGDEATVKTLRFRAGRPELHGDGVKITEGFTVLGKVLEVRRILEAAS